MEDPFIDELERLANNANASVTQSTGFGPKSTDIKRWMTLFHYNELEARYLIQRHRDDVIRNRISDAHWDLVRSEREALGYDREAYEHVLQLSDLFLEQAVTVPAKAGVFGAPPAVGEAVQIIRIGGILRNAEMVKEIGGLDEVPQVVEVVSEEGIPARLCPVPAEAKKRIKEWLDMQRVPQQTLAKKFSVAQSEYASTQEMKKKSTTVSVQSVLRLDIGSCFEFRDIELNDVDRTLPQRR